MKRENNAFYSFARILANIIYFLFFNAKARDLDNFPVEENSIILANHISGWDPITIAHFYKARSIHFMGKESLFKNPILALLLKWLHAFPVNRGKSDLGAMRTSLQIIHDGHVLGIFPEGHRQRGGRMQHIESGVAVLALRTNVPLIPVLLVGSYRFRGRIRMVVGKPVPLEDLRAQPATSATIDSVNKRFIDAVESLRPLADFSAAYTIWTICSIKAFFKKMNAQAGICQ